MLKIKSTRLKNKDKKSFAFFSYARKGWGEPPRVWYKSLTGTKPFYNTAPLFFSLYNNNEGFATKIKSRIIKGPILLRGLSPFPEHFNLKCSQNKIKSQLGTSIPYNVEMSPELGSKRSLDLLKDLPLSNNGVTNYFLSDFVDVQRKSFFTLLEKGLIEEFSLRNPITNTKKTIELFFYPEYYQLTQPDYTASEAIVKSKSYTSKLYIPVQLTTYNVVKLKWVYIGNIPLMTKRGHFILNGCARVIVNQMIRSPGLYYQKKTYETYTDQWSEKPENTFERYYADLICNRGTWLRIEMDKENRIWAQMKRVPKIPIMWFLLAMGLPEKMILKRVIDSQMLLYNLEEKSEDSDSDFTLPTTLKENKGLFKNININESQSKKKKKLSASFLNLKEFDDFEEQEFSTNYTDISETKKKKKKKPDKFPYFKTPPEAWKAIYNLISPKMGSARSRETKETNKRQKKNSLANQKNKATELGRKWFFNKFMNPRTYDLGKIGRQNFNSKLSISLKNESTTLTPQDLLLATDYLILVSKGLRHVDDIDHLKNRRVRTSGELIQLQIGIGLVRLEQIIREKMNKIEAQLLAIKDAQLRKKRMALKQLFISGASLLPARPVFGTKSKGVSMVGKPLNYKNQTNHESTETLKKQGGSITPQIFSLSSHDFFGGMRQDQKYLTKKRRVGTGAYLLSNDFWPDIKKNLISNHNKKSLISNNKKIVKKQVGRKSKTNNLSIIKSRATLKQASLVLFNNEVNKTLSKKELSKSKQQNPKQYKTLLNKKSKGTSFYAYDKEGALPSSISLLTISNIVNTKPFNGALKEFFGSSPLSQFMDQINPLAELTHKRRLSSMGPGGVTRDSATLEIRGIHPSHYGRICPVETPEGKNTGLVNSLTAYARVNKDGYIETPFYRVYKGQVQKKTGLFFFSAKQEEKINLGAADLYTTNIGFLQLASIPVRIVEDFTKISRNAIQYVGVAPIQMISIATSLIPFFEHDDGNRALMGSNMQRQAVPIIKPQRPIVGTGLEARTVSDSGHVIQTKQSGVITYVSSNKICLYYVK